jgi:serine/threonine protein kinase
MLQSGTLDLTIIDLGSAVYYSKSRVHLVTTRQYRSPEVLLGLQWSLSIDIWSLGCILYEFFSYTHRMVRKTLFHVHDDKPHWHDIYRLIRPLPKHMQTAYQVVQRKSFEAPDISDPIRLSEILGAQATPEWAPLVDLILKCLKVDPLKRITAEEAARHDFFIENP